LTSIDRGLTWDYINIPYTEDFNGLDYDGSYVYIAANKGFLIRSNDAFTTFANIVVSSDPDEHLHDVAITGGVYITGSTEGKVYRSTDGTTFVDVPFADEMDIVHHVAAAGTNFLMANENGKYYWSADGITWSGPSTPELAWHSGPGETRYACETLNDGFKMRNVYYLEEEVPYFTDPNDVPFGKDRSCIIDNGDVVISTPDGSGPPDEDTVNVNYEVRGEIGTKDIIISDLEYLKTGDVDIVFS
jgi:hypothetical protein